MNIYEEQTIVGSSAAVVGCVYAIVQGFKTEVRNLRTDFKAEYNITFIIRL